MAAHSAEPLDPSQRGESAVSSVKEASTARGSTRLQSKKRQNRGVEAPASPNRKASAHPVQKTGSCKAKRPKIAAACENCKSVIRLHHLQTCSYVNISYRSRHSRIKCSGERPFCDSCLRKGEQCHGYPAHNIIKKRNQAAAAQGSSHNIPAAQPSPVPEASNSRVGEDLQQNITTNDTISRQQVGTNSMDAQRTYLRSFFNYLDEPQENEQGPKG